jgi:hypothetical protein
MLEAVEERSSADAGSRRTPTPYEERSSPVPVYQSNRPDFQDICQWPAQM